MLDVVHLAPADVSSENLENRAHDLFAIDTIVVEVSLYVEEKALLMALLHRLSRRTPALEVKAADEHRQLRRQIGRFFDRQAVSQRMQYRSQGQISPVLIGPAQ